MFEVEYLWNDFVEKDGVNLIWFNTSSLALDIPTELAFSPRLMQTERKKH